MNVQLSFAPNQSNASIFLGKEDDQIRLWSDVHQKWHNYCKFFSVF